jgi:hypothetical protein
MLKNEKFTVDSQPTFQIYLIAVISRCTYKKETFESPPLKTKSPMYPPDPFSMNIPWWALPDAVLSWKTILIKEVACETCQWMPVPVAEAGMLREQGSADVPSLGNRIVVPSCINYEIPHRTEALLCVSLMNVNEGAIHAYKLSWFTYHSAPFPPGMYGSASRG